MTITTMIYTMAIVNPLGDLNFVFRKIMMGLTKKVMSAAIMTVDKIERLRYNTKRPNKNSPIPTMYLVAILQWVVIVFLPTS